MAEETTTTLSDLQDLAQVAASEPEATPEPKIESPDGLVNPEEHVAIREHGCEILSTDPGWELFVVD